jgi:hypothetical protein
MVFPELGPRESRTPIIAVNFVEEGASPDERPR